MSEYYHKYTKYKTKCKQLKTIKKQNEQNTELGIGSISESNNNLYNLPEKKDILVDIINKNFQKILQGYQNPKYHLFFESHEWFLKATRLWEKEIKDINCEYDDTQLTIETVDKCKYIPKKVISDKLLKEIYSIMTDSNTNDFKIIRENLNKLYDYLLPSNVPDITNYINKIKKVDKEHNINVIIAGAGPLGLFTALYLHEIYNNKPLLHTKVNIFLIDNRIYKEGIKLPYTRITQFGFDISQIQTFIKQIFCWKGKWMSSGTRQFDFVNILENMLYVVAYNYQIPMYFTKKYETFDKLNEFAINNNFDYIFDCTGGRLQTNFTDRLQWNKYLFKKGKYEIKLDDDGYYRFFVNDQLYSYITVVLHLYDTNMKEIHIGNVFGNTNISDDKELLEKYKNQCFTLNNYKKLARQFKDKGARCLLPHILENTKINEKNIKYVKVTYFDSNSRHASLCAKKLNKSLTYIGLGDTLGNSEYGIRFGMSSSMLFSKYICRLIGTFHNTII